MVNKLFVLISLIFVVSSCYAQEYLTNLYDNPLLKSTSNKSSSVSADSSTTLPFFDDFSYNGIFHSKELWTDNFTFINNSYAIGQPSFGVATFDAIDNLGKHYVNASSNPFKADKLSSKFIDLTTVNKDSLYLSFYYQPQGRGNAPESGDSLLLQFTSNGTDWETVWFAKGSSFNNFRVNELGLSADRVVDTIEFKQINIAINDVKYFTDKFRFRFMNYASLSGVSNPSAAINSDHWNIDYVYLNEHRFAGDTIFDDVVMIDEPGYLFKNYSSLPYLHYNEAFNSEIKKMHLHLRNNGPRERNVTQLSLYFENIETSAIDSFSLGQFTLHPFESRRFSQSFTNSPLPWNTVSKAKFKVEAKIKTDNLDFKGNNVSSNILNFDNYYAYDDGTAENAYGIDAVEGRVAIKYSIYKADSLRGISVFFARNAPQYAASESFYLCVWDNDNGNPGDLIAIEKGKRPVFADSLNHFVTITLDSSVFIEKDFFIGWSQSSQLRLNVGWDNNNNSKSKIFYSTSGDWVNTDYVGSLMVRPIFGAPIIASSRTEQKRLNLAIYPNPVSSQLTIRGLDNYSNSSVKILSTIGRVVFHSRYIGEALDISSLPSGMYVVVVIPEGKQPTTMPLIIAR